MEDHDLSVNPPEDEVNDPDECSIASTQEAPKTSLFGESIYAEAVFLLLLATESQGKGLDTMIKKVMQNIMCGKSVIYTKTDLTQICNKSNIRLEAVKRLVDANLLRHGDSFWIEPNRTRKETKKEYKRLYREGWIKYCVIDNVCSLTVTDSFL